MKLAAMADYSIHEPLNVALRAQKNPLQMAIVGIRAAEVICIVE
jgi:hypothetical protein